MQEEKQITPLISNEEHCKKVKDTYESEVKPCLSENRKAYELYLQTNLH